jgi:hypothetical protein
MGIAVGLIIFFLIYLYACLKKVDRRIKRSKNEIEDISKEQVRLIIANSAKEYKNKELKKEKGMFLHLKDVCLNEIKEIATLFNPHSPYPMLEMTIDEAIIFSNYLVKEVDVILSGKIFHLFRKYTIAQLFVLKDKQEALMNQKAVQLAQNNEVKSFGKTALTIINYFNPVYWIKKLFIDKTIKIVLDKVGLVVVNVVGEESYAIYSKKSELLEGAIDKDINTLYDEISSELKDIRHDIKKK